MSTHRFVQESDFPCSVNELFTWHERPGAFERLNPPWRPVRVLETPRSLESGGVVRIQLPIGPVGVPWLLEHGEYVPGKLFSDQQISGPFTYWKHLHHFEAISDSTATLRDELSFELPLALAAFYPLVQLELTRLFRFRHALLASDLKLHARWKEAKRQNIVVSGSSGLVGRSLCAFLATAGHTVTRLVRHAASVPNERTWFPEKGELSATALEGADVVIHLAGENIAGYWTTDKKRRIRDSRIESTRLLANVIGNMSHPPETFIVASAVGYYGETGKTAVDESAAPGTGFLADVCSDWEEASGLPSYKRTRVVNLRLGVVLNPRGGVLGKLFPLFRFALGGRVGTGKQFMSWIALQDLLGIVEECIFNTALSGPVNATSPAPCTNSEFVRTLGRVVRRPAILAAPTPILRTLLGEMADETMLASTRAIPAKLQNAGYSFQFPELESAIRFECGL